MKAKITKEGGYDCAPEGHTIRHFHKGQVVTGIVAKYAIADKAASAMFDKSKPLKNKATKPPENKKG